MFAKGSLLFCAVMHCFVYCMEHDVEKKSEPKESLISLSFKNQEVAIPRSFLEQCNFFKMLLQVPCSDEKKITKIKLDDMAGSPIKSIKDLELLNNNIKRFENDTFVAFKKIPHTKEKIEQQRKIARKLLEIIDWAGLSSEHEMQKSLMSFFLDLSFGEIDEKMFNAESFTLIKTAQHKELKMEVYHRNPMSNFQLALNLNASTLHTLWGLHKKIKKDARDQIDYLYVTVGEALRRVNLAYIASLFANINEFELDCASKNYSPELMAMPLAAELWMKKLRSLSVKNIVLPVLELEKIVINCPSLQYIKIENGAIAEIVISKTCGNGTLRKLILPNNHITKIPTVANFKSLNELNLSKNKIEKLDCTILPRSLFELIINQQTVIKEVIPGSVQFNAIYLSKNQEKMEVSNLIYLHRCFNRIAFNDDV